MDKVFKVVFLGTPTAVNPVLDALHNRKDLLSVIAVVCQPPARSKRGHELVPCPVHVRANELGIHVFHPEKAKDSDFLDALQKLQPDLCVTAAYGNILPEAFLKIPRFGTLNLHPSLLPKYRGAAPVQRCLQNRDKVTGVSVVQTVKELDAGPLLLQKEFEIDDEITYPELLNRLFVWGADLLIQALPEVFSGQARYQVQNESLVSYAPKLEIPESWLLPGRLSALECHAHIRAFWGWPGSKLKVRYPDNTQQSLKILKSRPIATDNVKIKLESVPGFSYDKSRLYLWCHGPSLLEILEIQPEGKKAMPATAFLNGLKGAALTLIEEVSP